MLTVGKDIYEVLGLTGKKSPFAVEKDDRFFINIDLNVCSASVLDRVKTRTALFSNSSILCSLENQEGENPYRKVRVEDAHFCPENNLCIP